MTGGRRGRRGKLGKGGLTGFERWRARGGWDYPVDVNWEGGEDMEEGWGGLERKKDRSCHEGNITPIPINFLHFVNLGPECICDIAVYTGSF